MEVLYPRCCGLDVHKSSITACVLLAQTGKPQKHIRRFGSTTRELLELVAWLREFGVEHVAMESTGVYWKPVWNVLEGQCQIVLANAQHIKAVPGRKTDTKDCQWIAELLQHGLLRASYIPSVMIRDLRDLTRARTSLSQEHSRIASRIQKVLEDANIKLASVASNALGKSGRAMLEAIIGGEESPERLADLALGHLRLKIPQLQTALEGRVRDHHRFLLRSLLRQLQFLEAEIELLDGRLDQIGREHLDLAEALDRWITVPGVDRVAAWSFIAEMGIDVTQFPTAAHLASWAGVCPGNNESAGKRISSKTRKGSPWLRRMACQSAWAAARTKNTYLSAQFKRLAARRGRKCAIIAVAHSILVIGYHLQRQRCTYADLGSSYFDRLHADGLKRYLVKRLESLGHAVILQPRTA
jgi:transposase